MTEPFTIYADSISIGNKHYVSGPEGFTKEEGEEIEVVWYSLMGQQPPKLVIADSVFPQEEGL